MSEIIPAVLSVTEDLYAATLKRLEESGLFDEATIQIDFADGEFVQNTTVDLEIVSKHPTSLKKEAHLMVTDPGEWVEDLAAQKFERVIWHIEVGETATVMELGRNLQMQVGLALNPETPVSAVEPFLAEIDVVQIMAIKPGFQGQQFIPESLEKIRQLVQMRKDLKFVISVDGGINRKNIKEIMEAGADRLVIGSALLEGDLDENLEALWEELRSLP